MIIRKELGVGRTGDREERYPGRTTTMGPEYRGDNYLKWRSWGRRDR